MRQLYYFILFVFPFFRFEKIDLKKMDSDERKEKIKEELKTELNGLTKSDRRILSVFLQYNAIEGVREKKKDWKNSPIYVRTNLFPYSTKKMEREKNGNGNVTEKEENEEIELAAETEPFRIEEINFEDTLNFPQLFKRDRDSVTKMLADGADGFTAVEECSMVRIFQVRKN